MSLPVFSDPIDAPLPAYVVAELCGNHAGNFDVAKLMIAAAKGCAANAVKFQKRCPKELLTPEQYAAPHPNPQHSYGSTYGEHRERLEFTIQQHVHLAAFCYDLGIRYSTSVWDLTSAKEVVEHISPEFIKVPSACNNHYPMLDYLIQKYSGDIHVSFGMTTDYEMFRLLAMMPLNRTVAYHCTSGYPVPFHKLFLKNITSLQMNWRRVGFSGHHLGIAADIAAYTLGAEYIERHFTLDRTSKGSDHCASLEPGGLAKLCRDLKAVRAALTHTPDEMDPIEVEQRDKLKYCVR